MSGDILDRLLLEAQKFANPQDRILLNCEIAEAYASCGRFEEALNIVERINPWSGHPDGRDTPPFPADFGSEYRERSEDETGDDPDDLVIDRRSDVWCDPVAHIAIALANAGAFADAAALTHKIEDPEWRSIALVELAEEQARAGLVDEAIASYAWAIVKFEADSEPELNAFKMRARALASAADGRGAEARNAFTLATALAAAIPDTSRQDRVMWDLVWDQIRTGLFDGAIATAIAYDTEDQRDQALGSIARQQAEAGHLEDALVTAARLETDAELEIVIENILSDWAQPGDPSRPTTLSALARGITAKLAVFTDEIWPLCMLARVHAHEGNTEAAAEAFEVAQHVARSEPDKFFQAADTFKVAAAGFEIGFNRRAAMELRAAAKFARDRDYQEPLCRWMAETAEYCAALELFDAAETLFIEALGLARSIEDRAKLVEQLRSIAVAQYDAGFELASRATIEEALNEARTISHPKTRTEAIIRTILSRNDDERFEEAKAIIDAIDDEGTRNNEYLNLTRALVDAGELELTSGVAGMMTPSDERDLAFDSIAQSWMLEGGVEATLESLNKMNGEDRRFQTFRGVIACAKRYLMDEALDEEDVQG